MSYFATPKKFIQLTKTLSPYVVGVGFLCFGLGVYFALWNSPDDYQQGGTVRIMYVHVPAAWMAMGVYFGMAIASVVGFVWKHPLANIATKAAAPIGFLFTLISLVTGSIWGKPMWGAWWVWDARLTSVLVLGFLYLGYIVLVRSYNDPHMGQKMGGVLILIGVVNLPIIKFSVDWWNTLHQPASILKASGPSIHKSMMLPLFLMFGAYFSFYLWCLFMRMEEEILRRKVRFMMLNHADKPYEAIGKGIV